MSRTAFLISASISVLNVPILPLRRRRSMARSWKTKAPDSFWRRLDVFGWTRKVPGKLSALSWLVKGTIRTVDSVFE